jgi:hypothetical protein
MTINNNLKIKIINDYLLGIKREVIAKKYGISAGSVSAIAEEFESVIPDIHKIRAMMVKLNAAGNEPKLFYPAIRLHNFIKNLGLSEVKAEIIIEMFQEEAFKKYYNLSDLIDSIINAYNIAQRCGTDLEHLDQHVNNRKMILEAKEAQIRKLNNDIEFLPHKLRIDLAEFQEYQRNQPIFQVFMNKVNESDIQARTIKLLKDQVKTLESKVHEKDIENERLKQLLSQRQEKEDEYITDYQQDIVNFDYYDLPVDDSNAVEDNADCP